MRMNNMLFIISFIMVTVAFNLNKKNNVLQKEESKLRKSYDSLLYIHRLASEDIIRYKKAIESLEKEDPSIVMKFDLLRSQGVNR